MIDDLTPSFELEIFLYTKNTDTQVSKTFLHSKNTSDHQIVGNNATKQKYTLGAYSIT